MYNGSSKDVINEYRNKIRFEEQAFSSIAKEHTLYFIAPKELLNDLYPNADSMEIAIKVPFRISKSNKPHKYGRMISDFDPNKAIVEFSPTKNGLDYNWYPGDLPIEEISYLLDIYHRWVKERVEHGGN